MKGKKLFKYIGGLALLGVFTLGVLALPVPETETAEAATLSGTVFKDDFSERELSDQWIKSDFSIDGESYYSMRLNNQTDYGSAMLYVDHKINTDCVISFDFYQSEVNAEKARDNWFGILLGYDDDSAHFTGGNAAILSYGRGQTQLMDDGDGASNKLVDASYNDHAKFPNSFNAAEGVVYTVELVLTYTGQRYTDGENLYRVDGYYYEKSGERPKSTQFSYKGIAADGYFGVSAMSASVIDVSNLQIFENGERVVYENFRENDGSGKKLLPNSESSVWKGINCSELKVYSYFNGRIDLSEQAEGLMLSGYELSADTLNKKTFEVSFQTEIIDLPQNSAFGVALGLHKNSVSAREGSFVGLCGTSEDKFKFVHIVNGEAVAQTGEIPKQLYGDGKCPVSFIGYYDGRLEVKLGGYTASFDDVVKGGYVGVATLGSSACEAYFSAFTIKRSDYVSSVAPNYAIDFTGTKETPEDDFVYVERYVDERIWYLGSGVAFPKVFKEDANFIQFTDSNERTFFGAKQQYSEFICRFSVTVTENRADAAGAYIGLSFGKANRNDRAADNPGILFGMTENGMILQGYQGTLEGSDAQGVLAQYENYPKLDFWSAEDWRSSPVTYRVMVIARGGNAYVYYANEADTSEMNVCKAVLKDVETSGYVTVSALGGATFRLNDFSVTNIALNAKAETASLSANETDVEYANVDFAEPTLYSVSGSTTELGRGLSLGYASEVKISEKFTDFLAYVDVKSVAGNGLEVNIGNKFIRLNADGTVYSTLKQVGGSGTFDFSSLKNGGTIMIEAIGTKLSVGVVGSDQPTDLLETPIAVYEIENRVQPVELSVATVSETVLSLGSVRLYTLKSAIAIETDNWEEGDIVFPEKSAPDEADGGNGCSNVVSCAAILPAIGLVLAMMRKKKEGQDE